MKRLKEIGVRKLLRNKDGTAAIEMSLVLPILLIVLFGCFQFGIFFSNMFAHKRVVDEAVRAVALMSSPTEQEILNFVNAKLPSDSAGEIDLEVDIIEKYDSKFLDLNMKYSYNMQIPLTDGYAMESSYHSFMLLSDASVAQDE